MPNKFKSSRKSITGSRSAYNYQPQNSLANEEKSMYTRIIITFVLIFGLAGSLYFWGTDIVLGIGSVWERMIPGSSVIDPPNQDGDYILSPRLEALPTFTNQSKLTVKGWSQPGSEVKLFINNEEVSVLLTDTSGRFEYLDLAIIEGKNTIYAVTSKDEATSAPSDEQSVTLDTVKPTLSVSVTDPTESGRVTVSGQSEVNANVYINGHRVILLNDGSFRDEVVLVEGENKIEVKSEDRAGNTEIVNKTLTYTKPAADPQPTPESDS